MNKYTVTIETCDGRSTVVEHPEATDAIEATAQALRAAAFRLAVPSDQLAITGLEGPGLHKRYYGIPQKGPFDGAVFVEILTCNGSIVQPLRHHVQHSPTGFAWGYLGSGPAELARCILWDHEGEEPTPTTYHLFKEQKIAGVAIDGPFEITSDEIDAWRPFAVERTWEFIFTSDGTDEYRSVQSSRIRSIAKRKAREEIMAGWPEKIDKRTRDSLKVVSVREVESSCTSEPVVRCDKCGRSGAESIDTGMGGEQTLCEPCARVEAPFQFSDEPAQREV